LDSAATILTLWNLALEESVFHGVVLGLHREVVAPLMSRNAFRERPTCEHPAVLEPEIVVQSPRLVPLDDEHGLACAECRPPLRDRFRAAGRAAPAHVVSMVRLSSCSRCSGSNR